MAATLLTKRQVIHRRINRRLTVGLILVALLLGQIGAVMAQGGTTLRLAMPPILGATAQSPIPDPASLPMDALDARDLVENLFVGLFRYDAASQSAAPVLAQTWTTSDDGLTWTFILRDDIQWVGYNPDSGQIAVKRAVTAEDVVAGIRRACHPLKPSPDGPAMLVIQGCYTASQADPLLVDDTRVAGWVAAEAPDSTTLVLRLAFPVAYLPSLLAQPEFRPVPREFIDFMPAWPAIASSGPYVYTGWTPGESLTLVRNPFWPDDLPGTVERIAITYAAADEARADLYRSGAVDFARLGGSGPALMTQMPGAVFARRGGDVMVLGFSAERAFVNRLGVRQALAWSLDREALAAADPLALPVTTLTSPGAIAGPGEAAGLGFEPDAARAALASAGYGNCVGVPEVIRVAAPPELAAAAEQITAGWTATFGCVDGLFEVVTPPAETVVSLARGLVDFENTLRPHIWIAPWAAYTLDAHGGAADALHCRFGYFYSGLACGPVDALIDWAGEAVGEDRADVYARLEGRLFGPAGTTPVTPLWAVAEYVGAAASLEGPADFGPAWWGEWSVE